MIKSTLRPVMTAYGRALKSQFTGKMLLLSVLPVLLSLALWGVLLYFGLEPAKATIGAWMPAPGGTGGGWFAQYGAGALKVVAVTVIAALLTLPVMIFTSLLFMGVAAMPAIVAHVAGRQFPALTQQHGGSFAGSVKTNLGTILVAIPLWLLTLPLYVIPPLAVLVQVLLWGRVASIVMCYDALADHASDQERRAIMRDHRRQLTLIGMLSGAIGALPGIVWIGGTLISVVLFPILAVIAVWIYVLIFIFTGLWFQYYCMQALEDLRAAGATAPAAS